MIEDLVFFFFYEFFTILKTFILSPSDKILNY